MGDPALEPERSWQADLWVEGSYERVSIDLNGFARRVDDYITLQPTDLPKRLPLSPVSVVEGDSVFVFQYANGDASFFGFEASATVLLARGLTGSTGVEYLWAEDETLDEPALGISPPGADLGLRYEAPSERFHAEAVAHLVAEQDRVATTRGERTSEGYTTLDLRAGARLPGGVELRAGVLNLLDEAYVNHLNANDPFTGRRIAEPGRVLFVDVAYAF